MRGWGLRSNYISAVGIQVFQDVHRRFVLFFKNRKNPSFTCVCAQGNIIPHIYCHYRAKLEPSPFLFSISLSLSLTPSGGFRKRMLPDLTSFLFQLWTVRWFRKKKEEERHKRKKKKTKEGGREEGFETKNNGITKISQFDGQTNELRVKMAAEFLELRSFSCISWRYKNAICWLIPP